MSLFDPHCLNEALRSGRLIWITPENGEPHIGAYVTQLPDGTFGRIAAQVSLLELAKCSDCAVRLRLQQQSPIAVTYGGVIHGYLLSLEHGQAVLDRQAFLDSLPPPVED